ncbi:hypothetical protein HOLleu_06294 [Holothuria leucospilota]|uniref:Uncharacterized protein n=1 Tax=Holothuria leucospilota TaxID=206669 RepID=A0A9Q1CLW8_HOLLE|nr:hypothetical protein HOLleu_06294 [Holothuria leucospilota]
MLSFYAFVEDTSYNRATAACMNAESSRPTTFNGSSFLSVVQGFSERNQNRAKDNGHELKELKSSLDDLRRKLVAKEDPSLSSKSLRSRRNVDNGAQISENVCPGCSGPYTPYFSGQCFLCPPGTPGPRGPPGQQGIPGRDGRDGRDATVDHSVDWISDAEDFPQAFAGNKNASGGTVYVRWGRNECPLHSELAYQSVA